MTLFAPSASFLLLLAPAIVQAQEARPNLKAFFEGRLSNTPGTPSPSYQTLLQVIDTIESSDPHDLRSAIPVLSLALASKTTDVPAEAAFAFFAISRRRDGGALLRTNAPEIAALMMSTDTRLSAGSVAILRNLTASIPDVTVPLLMNRLRSATPPTLVTAEAVRALLESPMRTEPNVLRTVEEYLAVSADQSVTVENLHAIMANGVTTPVITKFVLGALSDKRPQVQMAAITTTAALGAGVREQARSTIGRLANDPNADKDVRSLAERALQNKLSDPYVVTDHPAPPKLK